MLFISMAVNVFAADKVPREDFIKYSDSCIDIIDELETAFSKFEITKLEADILIKNYNLSIKKFDRFGDYGKWDENSLQRKIVGNFKLLSFMLDLRLIELDLGNIDLKTVKQEIQKSNNETKESLLIYRESSPTKKKLKK